MNDIQLDNLFLLVKTVILFITLAIFFNTVLVLTGFKDMSKKTLENMAYWLVALITLLFVFCSC